MKKLIVVTTAYLICTQLLGQNSNFKYEFQLPPSPNSASLGKYGEIPIDYYNGIPKINIPLYNLATRSLNLDLALSYHMSGIRVDEEASWVGLGWTLNASGVITRVIKNKDDDYNSQSCPDQDPDMFYFNFLGRSGKFIIHPVTKNIILINQEAILISKINPNSLTAGFLITLNDGVKLYFDVTEYQVSTEESSVNSFIVTKTFITSWYLSKIEAIDGDVITFEYTGEFPAERKYNSFTDFHTTSVTVGILEWASGGIQGGGCYQLSDLGLATQDPNVHFLIGNYATVNYRNRYLQKINFGNGSITFITSNREDFLRTSSNSFGQKLDQIILKNKLGVTVKRIVFGYSYLNSQQSNGALSKRLILTDFKESTPASNTAALSYFFYYNNSPNNQLPDKNSRDQDHWGFYNGPKNNPITPSQRDKNPDAFYCRAGVLEKIIYPTGGYTVFETGINEFVSRLNETIVYQGGGLRVNKITSYSSDGKIASIKKYEYKKINQNNQLVCSGKSIGVTRDWYDYVNNYLSPPFNYTRPVHKRGSGCQLLYGGGGAPVIEWATIRYLTHNEATSSSNTLPLGEHSANGNPVCYSKVIEYYDETGSVGKTEYEFKNEYATPDFSNSYYYPNNMPQVVPITNGQLQKTSIFRKVSNTYELVKENIYTYSSKAYQAITGKRKCDIDNMATNCGWQLDYNIFSDWIVTSSETVNQNSINNQVMSENIIYSYDNSFHKQLTNKQKSNSLAVIENEYFKYPSDFSGSNVVYQTMVNKYITGPIIEYQKVVGSNNIIKTKTEYDNFFTTLQLPKTEFIQIGNYPNEERIRYDYSDKGKLIEQNKINDYKSAFLWDHNSTYPIAKANNCPASDIKYTSFEGDGTGNWYFTNSGIVIDASSPTGDYGLNISTQQVNGFALSPSKKYRISYWYKQGSVINVNWGTQTNIIVGPTKNGWTYTERNITGTNQISLEGTGFIDELRLIPSDASLITYTYEPLVGMTTLCDENNRITYFEYDDFNRLMLVRDYDGNIIKKVCYNYSGQTENCTVFYNTPYSQNFTKQCPPGYISSTVQYSIPAQIYSSIISQPDADSKAIAYVQANGQTYANAVATCTYNGPVVTINGSNAKSSMYQVKFTNNATGNWYTFFLNPNTYSLYYLGQIPSGTYSVQFYPAGSPVYSTFNINGYTQYGQYGATFYNISITSTSQALMY